MANVSTTACSVSFLCKYPPEQNRTEPNRSTPCSSAKRLSELWPLWSSSWPLCPSTADGWYVASPKKHFLPAGITYLSNVCVCVNILSGAFSRAVKATVPRVVPVPVPRSCGVLITKLPTATLLVQASIGRQLAETSTDPLLRPTRPLEEPPVERLVEHLVQVPLERLSQWPDPLRASCPPSLNTLPP